MEQIFTLAIVGLVILIFALLILAGIAQSRKAAEQSHQTAVALGFTPLDPPPPEVAERIIALHQRGFHQELEVRNLHRQSSPTCTLYLYDIWDVSGSDNDLVASSSIALVSPDLDLPHFLLFPKVNVVGWTGDMANQFIEKLVGLHSQVLNFEDRPNFDKRYLVVGDDEFAVRRCLTGPVLAALTQTQVKELVFAAWGDIFVLTDAGMGGRHNDDPAAGVNARRNLALVLHERLHAVI